MKGLAEKLKMWSGREVCQRSTYRHRLLDDLKMPQQRMNGLGETAQSAKDMTCTCPAMA